MSSTRRGFTLIEILVVLAVLGVVTAIGTRVFVELTGAWRQAAIRTDLNEQAQRAIDAIRRDVSQVLSPRLSGVGLTNISAMEDQQRYGRVPLENDQLVLPIEFMTPDGLARQSILYSIDRGGEVPVLRRTVGAFPTAPGDFAEMGSAVAEGVLSMRVEIVVVGRAYSDWRGRQTPEAVRVSIVVQDPDRPHEQIARTAEFPVGTS